jgi:ABC-type antimicrobial peptide transport system permease subunit
VFRIRTLEVETRDSLARERMLAGLTTYFGAFAWLLAGIGLYGLLTCTVAQRTREFGLRMALGASPRGIRLAVLRDSAGTVTLGLLAGVVLSLLAVRVVRAQLYGVAPVDSMIVAGSVMVLLVLGGCASFLPARRASRIDPMSALRQE